MLPLFYKLPHNISRLFHGRNLVWFIVAMTLSTIIVYSGFDWLYFSTMRNSSIYTITFPAVIVGAIVPIFGILMYLSWGMIRKNRSHIMTAWALGQASIAGYLVSTALKAFTGRIQPPHVFISGMNDVSHGFNFGFLENGIFWGWPSSHTAVAFAMAGVLIALYPRNRIVQIIALIYALYIGIGVSMSIHWFSEFAVGTIIGLILGSEVGKSFYKKVHK